MAGAREPNRDFEEIEEIKEFCRKNATEIPKNPAKNATRTFKRLFIKMFWKYHELKYF